jgi:hypothetical protein
LGGAWKVNAFMASSFTKGAYIGGAEERGLSATS